MDTRGIDLKIGPIDNPHLHTPGVVNMGNPHVVFFVRDVIASMWSATALWWKTTRCFPRASMSASPR